MFRLATALLLLAVVPTQALHTPKTQPAPLESSMLERASQASSLNKASGPLKDMLDGLPGLDDLYNGVEMLNPHLAKMVPKALRPKDAQENNPIDMDEADLNPPTPHVEDLPLTESEAKLSAAFVTDLPVAKKMVRNAHWRDEHKCIAAGYQNCQQFYEAKYMAERKEMEDAVYRQHTMSKDDLRSARNREIHEAEDRKRWENWNKMQHQDEWFSWKKENAEGDRSKDAASSHDDFVPNNGPKMHPEVWEDDIKDFGEGPNQALDIYFKPNPEHSWDVTQGSTQVSNN